MSCCGISIPRGMIDQMCEQVKEVERFQKKFILEFRDPTVRKYLKMIAKQYHIDEVAHSGPNYYFDLTGAMVKHGEYKYRVRYKYFDERFGDFTKFEYYF